MRLHSGLIFLLATLLLGLSACATHQTKREYSQDMLECQVGSSCALQGRLHILSGAPASVAYLDLADSHCVALSLPETIYRKKTYDGRLVGVFGQAHMQPTGTGVTSYLLEDRYVAAGVCETGIIIYVEELQKLSSTGLAR